MDALKNTVLCRDEEDYKFLWNCILIQALIRKIKVYCLCLMSNHFHFLISATKESIEEFFARLKIQLGRFLKKKYGSSPAHMMKYQLFVVSDRRMFCNELAYILRNPYKARFSGPLFYKWSSAPAYFTHLDRTGKLVGAMSTRERNAVLKTRAHLPEYVKVGKDGMILPESIVDIDIVEKMFGNSSVLFFDSLKKWNLEDIVDESHGDERMDAFSDEDVYSGIRDICRNDFGNAAPEKMDSRMLGRLARKVFNRFGCSRAQLTRLLPVDAFLLDRAL